MDRREFLTGSMGATLLAALPADLMAQSGGSARPRTWDPGRVRHLLPTVNHTRMLIKASFADPLTTAPTLRVGGRSIVGQMNDTRGEFWQFYADGLQGGRRYSLSLAAKGGKPLCQPWDLSTFPDANARPDRFRLLIFTCAGGHDALQFLPAAVRNRLLRDRKSVV